MSYNIVTDMTIARQRFGNSRFRDNEQKLKSIVNQRLTKLTVPRRQIKQSNTQTFGNVDLYSVRLEVSSVQESSVASDSAFVIHVEVVVQAYEISEVKCSAMECSPADNGS
jgi:hypothetical protein